ncbi:MAG: hypothetical protein DHS20C05_03140 [Hyphococcus sp.]|nr:MAG: hypothetical protein DHS20C05_03140 [Marinicaulis sp.]
MTVYDGITLDQVQNIFANTSYNGTDFTVVKRQTDEDISYLAITAPDLPFAIFLSVIEESYSGSGDGVYAGIGMFTPVKTHTITQDDINQFNLRHNFVKLTPGQSGSLYGIDVLMAGGMSEEGVVLSLIPFFGGLKSFIDLATTQTVSNDNAQPTPKIVSNLSGRDLVFDKISISQTETLILDVHDIRSERLVEEFVNRISK